MGEDALIQALASTSRGDADDYARVGGFVAELGQAALDLLDAARAKIGAAVAQRAGSKVADYVRLRFTMRKPA